MFEEIILFTSPGCKNCLVIERLLMQKGLPYFKETDVSKIIELGYTSAPILKINKEIHDFNSARAFLIKI